MSNQVESQVDKFLARDQAYACQECGSTQWCLRRDGKIECAQCLSEIENVAWQPDPAREALRGLVEAAKGAMPILEMEYPQVYVNLEDAIAAAEAAMKEVGHGRG